MKTKMTLTMDQSIKDEAARQSIIVLGEENVSAYFRFLINREKKFHKD